MEENGQDLPVHQSECCVMKYTVPFLMICVFGFVSGCSRDSSPTSFGKTNQAASRIQATLTQITTDPGREFAPSLSPDGRWIAFYSRKAGNDDIWLTTPRGDTLIQVTYMPHNEINPRWSPDGKLLAYVSYHGQNRGDIMVLSPFGGETSQLTFTGSGIREIPSWSPSGDRIAYSSFESGNWDIWVVGLNGPTPRRLTMSASSDLAPSWSPDGRNIAFASDRSGNPDIWEVPVSGTPATQITFSESADDFPSFSPDGKYVAFSSTRANKNGSSDIWLYSLDTGKLHRLTDDAGDDIHPSWSSDGKKIVFSSNRSGSYDIWMLDLVIGNDK